MFHKPSSSRRRAPPPPPTASQQRAALARDIDRVVGRGGASASDPRLQVQQDLLRDTVVDVRAGCARVGALLADYEAKSAAAELAPDAPPPPPMAEAAAADDDDDDEAATLRTLAADDTAIDVASVANYAAHPPSAPPFATTSVAAAQEGMAASLAKVTASLANIEAALAEAHQWWLSQILLRRLRTHAVRINYHGRLMKRWGNQARSHLYVATELSNSATAGSAADLARLGRRAAELRAEREGLAAREAGLSSRLAAARAELGALQLAHEQQGRQLQADAEAAGAPRVAPEAVEGLLLLQAVGRRLPHMAGGCDRMAGLLRRPGALLDGQ